MLALFTGCAAFGPLVASGQSACLAAAPRSNLLIGELKQWMETTDPERIAHRDTLFMIPQVNMADITLVSDATICAKVVAKYPEPRPAQVFVIRLGNKGYASLDPTGLTGEYENVHIFDRKFKRVGGWTG